MRKQTSGFKLRIPSLKQGALFTKPWTKYSAPDPEIWKQTIMQITISVKVIFCTTYRVRRRTKCITATRGKSLPTKPSSRLQLCQFAKYCELHQGATMKSFLIALHTKCHPDDRSKKGEVGRTCGTYRNKRGAYRMLMGNPIGKT